jgi:hypothetical protein
MDIARILPSKREKAQASRCAFVSSPMGFKPFLQRHASCLCLSRSCSILDSAPPRIEPLFSKFGVTHVKRTVCGAAAVCTGTLPPRTLKPFIRTFRCTLPFVRGMSETHRDSSINLQPNSSSPPPLVHPSPYSLETEPWLLNRYKMYQWTSSQGFPI